MNLPKRVARKILLQNNQYSLHRYTDLCQSIKARQFTIIAYKKHGNTEPVSALIEKLGIGDEIEKNDSFLYMTSTLKFVFVRADIPEEDMCCLLRHELGHICDPDFTKTMAQDSRIKKEEFANAFSLYAKNPGMLFRLYIFWRKHWMWLAASLAILLCIGAFILHFSPPAEPALQEMRERGLSQDVYYVTSQGKKYHRKQCITVKYRNNVTPILPEDAPKSGYTPCHICCPD